MTRKIVDKIYEFLGKKLLTHLIKRNSRVPMEWYTDQIITIVCDDCNNGESINQIIRELQQSSKLSECRYIGHNVNKDGLSEYRFMGPSLDDCKKLGLWKEKFGSLLRSR